MKNIILNWRYYAIAVIGFIVVFGIFSIPEDSLPTQKWLVAFILTKSIGLGAGYVLLRLVAYWSKNDHIPELTKMIEED